MKKNFAPKNLKFSLVICCLCAQKKSALKSKDFFTFCIHPFSEKKDILLTFSEPCYSYVGEGLAGQPLLKAG